MVIIRTISWILGAPAILQDCELAIGPVTNPRGVECYVNLLVSGKVLIAGNEPKTYSELDMLPRQ